MSPQTKPGPNWLPVNKTQWVTPTVKIGILSAQNEVHRAIETQTEIGWLHMFRGFVSIDWGHVNMEADLIPNPSKNVWRAADRRQDYPKEH